MSVARGLLALLVLAGCLIAGGLFVSSALHAFNGSAAYHAQTQDEASEAPASAWTPDGTTPGTLPGAPASSDDAPAAAQGTRDLLGRDPFAVVWRVLLLAGVVVAGVLLVVGTVMGALSVRWLRMRSRRVYALYELHLSMHDEAKPQDLEDMVEAIANIVRAWPRERLRAGQPFVAVELICAPGAAGLEWSINVRCQPRVASALDAAISAAYPDVRLGRTHAARPEPCPGALREPGRVLRFRKERSFVYPLVAAGEALASPPLEQIAAAQIGAGEPSVVRFQLTPTPALFEGVARGVYRRHENKLVRQERWGLPEGGLESTLNRAEMGNAQRTQNRSLFWLEAQVAADSPEAAKVIAAAVQSRRGENRLHRRWMLVRRRLYRRRFPRALGPLVPSPRCLVFAAEVAHLLALPSARMKFVPVRRVAVPRIPAPPEARRVEDGALWWPQPRTQTPDTRTATSGAPR